MPLSAAGVIAEFNPFHEGHRLLLKAARDNGADVILVAISGNFVQRGEPALLPKRYRASMALHTGADLVVELPLPWAMSGAETFAAGGVALLSALGAKELWFGSECGSASALLKTAHILETERFQSALRRPLESGMPFAAARETAVESMAGSSFSSLLREPNNTLGIEYCRAILRQKSRMEPHSIARVGPGHHCSSIVNSMASASALRKEIRQAESPTLWNAEDWNACIPPVAGEILSLAIKKGECPSRVSRMETAILSTLRRIGREDFSHLPDISEGLENRIYQMVQKAPFYEELLRSIKSKRYSMARIRRILMSAYLGICADDAKGLPPYLRILGFTSRGKEYLKSISKELPLPVLTTSSQLKALDGRAAHIFQLESKSSDLYALSLPSPPPCGEEYRHKLIKITE